MRAERTVDERLKRRYTSVEGRSISLNGMPMVQSLGNTMIFKSFIFLRCCNSWVSQDPESLGNPKIHSTFKTPMDILKVTQPGSAWTVSVEPLPGQLLKPNEHFKSYQSGQRSDSKKLNCISR